MESHSENIRKRKNFYSLKNLKQTQVPKYIKIKILSNKNCQLKRKAIIEEINSNISSNHDSPNQSNNNNISIQNNILINYRLQNINILPYCQEIQKSDYINSLSAKYLSTNNKDIGERNKLNHYNKFVSPLQKSQNFDNNKIEIKNKLLDEIIKAVNKKRAKKKGVILPKINSNKKNLSKNKKNKNSRNKKNNIDKDKNNKKIENKTNENNFYEPIKINYILKKVKNDNKDDNIKERENIKMYNPNDYEETKDINTSIIPVT